VKRAKLFVNGRSQAVRLPKEFRMPGHEVFIEKRGDALILLPTESGDRWARFHAAVGAAQDFPDRADEGTPERRKPLK
jgi:antitoxin VapB